jgi:hypothetical protein
LEINDVLGSIIKNGSITRATRDFTESAFAKFEDEFDPAYLHLTLENAAVRDHIRIDFKRLSSTNAGFATFARGSDGWKMRIAIHDELDLPSRFGVTCHWLTFISGIWAPTKIVGGPVGGILVGLFQKSKPNPSHLS